MMNATDLFPVLVLLSFAVNLADWMWIRRGGFFIFPRSGPWRAVFAGWSVLLAALAILALFHVAPRLWFVGAGAAWMICSQVYAIVVRHFQSQAAP